jgi:MFS family permease
MLVIGAYLALFSLPAALLSLVGLRVVSTGMVDERPRNWVPLLLGAGVALALPLGVLGGRFESPLALLLVLLIPTLVALLALILIQWRAVRESWRERPRLVSALLLALALLLGLMALGQPPQLPLVVLLPALVVALVWSVTRRMRQSGLVFSGLLLAALLGLEAVGLAGGHQVHATPWLWSSYRAASVVVIILAPILAALLVDRGMAAIQDGEYPRAVSGLIVAGLLVLGLAAAELRHGILVEATARAAEDHLPVATVAAGLVAGLLLTFGLSQLRPRAGLAFTLLLPLLFAFSYTAGALFEPQEITAGRAARLDRAIQSYYGDHKAYPTTLGDLSPDYAPYILGPLTGRGQTWCYQSGPDFYRLGYVIFQRYYEPTYPTPFYEIRVAGSAGQLPGIIWQCDEELWRIKQTGGL